MKLLTTLVVITALACSNLTAFAKQPTASDVNSELVQHEVYINQASLEELETLKGIGNKKAQAIIRYREINGKFTSMEDLLNVKGIGEKIIAANLNRLKI